jgi:hypothetical protein
MCACSIRPVLSFDSNVCVCVCMGVGGGEAVLSVYVAVSVRLFVRESNNSVYVHHRQVIDSNIKCYKIHETVVRQRQYEKLSPLLYIHCYLGPSA